MSGSTSFTAKKAKVGKDNKTYYQEVGTVIIREDGMSGVLFLNHLDGDYALFKKEPKEDRGDAAGGETPVMRNTPSGKPPFRRA